MKLLCTCFLTLSVLYFMTHWHIMVQGNAKSLYMVTDGDLKKLGSLTKPNPQNK